MRYNRNRLLALLIALVLMMASFNVMASDRTLEIAAGVIYEVTATTELSELTISEGAAVVAAEGYLLSLVVDGVEQDIEAGTYTGDVALVLTEDYSDTVMGSFDARGGEEFRSALYIDETGIVADKSVEEAIAGGSYDNSEAEGISITGNSENFSAVIIDGAEYSFKDATITLDGKSDGLDANGETNISDFSGLGSAIAIYNEAKVTFDNVDIFTSGVGRPNIFADAGSDVLVTDSAIESVGGDLYEGYVNSANQFYMIAPPWVLGITGNARTTNLMGELSTTTVVRTDAKANQWGVLSTDSGSEMVLTVVDSTLTLVGDGQNDDPFSENYGSGYGTYIIGDAQEYFYGVTMNVGTYGSILTGGDAIYASSNFEEPLDIYSLVQIPNGGTAIDWMGNEYETYDVEKAAIPEFTGITGLGQITTINSDAFGFMAHNSGSLTVTDGTVINSDNATFLMKNGDVDMVVSDGAVIDTEEGIILQIIDNDDALVGIDMNNMEYMPAFNTEFNEVAGYPGIDYVVDVTTEGRNTYTFTATDVDLEGDLYNGSGYFGGQAADLLEVTIGEGATLEGAISSTSVVHVDEYGNQATHFTMDEYYYLGHVANRANYNGGNDISVSLVDGAVWTVDGLSLVNELKIDADAMIKPADGKVLTVYVDGKQVTITNGMAYDLQGEITITVSDEVMPVSMGSVDGETLMILQDKTDNPTMWIEFIDQMSGDAVGRWFSTLIKKLVD